MDDRSPQTAFLETAPLDTNAAPQAADQIWHTVQGRLRDTLGERVHTSWTGQLNFQCENQRSVALTTPSKFVASRIENKYGDLLRTIWAQYDPRHVEICAKADVKDSLPDVGAVTATTRAGSNPMVAQSSPTGNKAQSAQFAKTPPPFSTSPLMTSDLPSTPAVPSFGTASPAHVSQGTAPTSTQAAPDADTARSRFTFDNFVVGPSNELAHAVARKIAMSQDCQYNPVIIHGPHGMGKTHLLYAIKAHIQNDGTRRRVKLISAENFVASFVQSVRAQGRKEIDAFKASLRDVDVLIIDDAHFIADKPGSQEELLHTLIALLDSGKQILLASDRHPHAIAKASERLKSYLCSGLLCDIGACDYELRLRILDRLIERRRQNGYPSLAMPQNARDHLAARINATPRDLEGAFSQVVARLEFLGRPLTLESVQDALSHARYSSNARPTVDKIQKACAKEFNITIDEILSKRRARAIARPRQVAMYLSKTLTTRSLPDIGRRFGGRDHTTVIHAVKRIEELRAKDDKLNTSIETLVEVLKG